MLRAADRFIMPQGTDGNDDLCGVDEYDHDDKSRWIINFHSDDDEANILLLMMMVARMVMMIMMMMIMVTFLREGNTSMVHLLLTRNALVVVNDDDLDDFHAVDEDAHVDADDDNIAHHQRGEHVDGPPVVDLQRSRCC